MTSNCGAVVLLGVDYYWGCLGRRWGFVGGRIRERYLFGGVVVGTDATDGFHQIRIGMLPELHSQCSSRGWDTVFENNA